MSLERKLLSLIYRPVNIFGVRQIGYYVIKKKKKYFNLDDYKIKVEVEKDAKKLVSEVCGTNFLAEGGENIKIKPDSEYPDWLWKVHIGPPLPLEKLDPTTKHYWNRVYKWGRLEAAYLLKFQRHKTFQK